MECESVKLAEERANDGDRDERRGNQPIGRLSVSPNTGPRRAVIRKC
jgi:hypothetical protein